MISISTQHNGNATKIWILISYSISVCVSLYLHRLSLRFFLFILLSVSFHFEYHFYGNFVSVCIQLVSANIILNLSIFISKFSDHLFSNLSTEMCQEKKEERIGYVLSQEIHSVEWGVEEKIFLPVADCTYGDEHRKYWSTTSPLATIRFCDFILLDLLSLSRALCFLCLPLQHCSFSYSSRSFVGLFCLTKLWLYYVIDVLTYLPSQNRFYHDPFTPSLYSLRASHTYAHTHTNVHLSTTSFKIHDVCVCVYVKVYQHSSKLQAQLD